MIYQQIQFNLIKYFLPTDFYKTHFTRGERPHCMTSLGPGVAQSHFIIGYTGLEQWRPAFESVKGPWSLHLWSQVPGTFSTSLS